MTLNELTETQVLCLAMLLLGGLSVVVAWLFPNRDDRDLRERVRRR